MKRHIASNGVELGHCAHRASSNLQYPISAALAVVILAGTVLAQPMNPRDQADRNQWRETARSNDHPAAGHPARAAAVQFRSYDGTGNNTSRRAWGAAGVDYLREASGAHYSDGISAPAGTNRPSARAISNALSAQGDLTQDSRHLSTLVYEFGQFLDHDIGLVKGAYTEAFDIAVPTGDPYFDPASTGTKKIYLDRSAADPATGVRTAREQMNTVTAFIDASQVYGSDAVRAAWLRAGTGGRLKSRSTSAGELLPLNDGTLANDNPLGLPAASLIAAGDSRANEQPGLTVLHTVFLREHNFQAARLQRLHSGWDDERLYQEARRIVGAEMQVIVTREFLPALIGRELPDYRGYKPNVNPGISNAFAAAAYRFGHSLVGPDIGILDANFVEVSNIDLADAFFNPTIIPGVGGVDPIVRYMVTDIMQSSDTRIVDPLRNFLFGPPGAGGFDLAALNIQRGRDHGLADYNTMRADLGLARVTSFAQITSSATLASTLQSLYGTVDNIDAWVGMLAEDHMPNASVGQSHAAAMIRQFTALRDGDRFWYQNGQFSRDDLVMLESTRLSDILARNSGTGFVRNNVFFADPVATSTACVADFNHDGRVDSADLNGFLAAWQRGQRSADVNHDRRVDNADLERFFEGWHAGC